MQMGSTEHFDVRQELYKVADGNKKKWSQVAYSVFRAERVTIRKCMGYSPYYATMGMHSLFPVDIIERHHQIQYFPPKI
jgi:hypothetical protein